MNKKFLISSFLFFLLFLVLTYFVAREYLDQFDFDMTVKWQDKIPARFDDEFSSLSLLGSFEVTTVIFVLLTYTIGTTWVRRFFMSLVYPFFHVIEIIGKTVIDKVPPPFMFHRYAFDFHFPSSYVSSDHFSYPSGHVGRTALLVTLGILLVWYSFKKWKFKIPIIGSQLGLWGVMLVSRIVLGEHWATDTIGGTLLGVSMGLLAWGLR
jgi:membrane-associated phospholipid phosphatase